MVNYLIQSNSPIFFGCPQCSGLDILQLDFIIFVILVGSVRVLLPLSLLHHLVEKIQVHFLC